MADDPKAKAPETKAPATDPKATSPAPAPNATTAAAPVNPATPSSAPTTGQTKDPEASPSNPASNPEPRMDAADTLTPNPVDLTPSEEGADTSGKVEPMTPLEQARADYPPGPQVGEDTPLAAATVLAGQVFDKDEAEYVCRYCGASAFETRQEWRTHIQDFHPGQPIPRDTDGE